MYEEYFMWRLFPTEMVSMQTAATTTGSGGEVVDAPGNGIPAFRQGIYTSGFAITLTFTILLVGLILKALCCQYDKSRKRLAVLMIVLVTGLSFSIATMAQVGLSQHPDDINSAMSKTESLAVLGVGMFAVLALTSTWRNWFVDKKAAWFVGVTHAYKVFFAMLPIGWLTTWLTISYFDASADEFSVARGVAVYSAVVVIFCTVVCLGRFLHQACANAKSIQEIPHQLGVILVIESLCLFLAVVWSLACVSIDIRTRYATNMQASRFILTLFIAPLVFLLYIKTSERDETHADSATDYSQADAEAATPSERQSLQDS